ncbi:MAG TPA: hypothetical protein VMU67_13295 [Steroidobacteraceae bacterium]|nr:hypothetical protein [Steroidobacteraceae bacterium]
MLSRAARRGARGTDTVDWRADVRREMLWIMSIKLAALILLWWLFFRGGAA